MWDLATIERSPRRIRQLAIRYRLVAAVGPNIQHLAMREVGCSKEPGDYIAQRALNTVGYGRGTGHTDPLCTEATKCVCALLAVLRRNQ